jgi:hypothetical protein
MNARPAELSPVGARLGREAPQAESRAAVLLKSEGALGKFRSSQRVEPAFQLIEGALMKRGYLLVGALSAVCISSSFNAVSAQASPPAGVHLPTSSAIDTIRKVVRDDLGYPIDRYPKLYFFDALPPLFTGYVSIGFYGNGQPINHFEINEKTGQVVDSVICEVYDFPDLRAFQREQQQLSGSRARTTEELMDEIGCQKLKVVRSSVVPSSKPPKK